MNPTLIVEPFEDGGFIFSRDGHFVTISFSTPDRDVTVTTFYMPLDVWNRVWPQLVDVKESIVDKGLDI